MASTAKYYRSNPKARATRLKQRKKYNKTTKGKQLRVNANRLNRQLGTYGNGDGKDAAHYRGVLPREDYKIHPLTEKADSKCVNDTSTT